MVIREGKACGFMIRSGLHTAQSLRSLIMLHITDLVSRCPTSEKSTFDWLSTALAEGKELRRLTKLCIEHARQYLMDATQESRIWWPRQKRMCYRQDSS